MKRKLLGAMCVLALCSSVWAYNPPLGGENVNTITSPVLIGGAASGVGGPTFTIVPSSIRYNPAITAMEQRITVDANGSLIFNTKPTSSLDNAVGGGFELGGIIPTRFCVFGVSVNGAFANFNRMNLGDSLDLRLGASKEIIEKKLSVGMNLYSGFYMGNSFDWTIGADFGALYIFDDLGFLKAPRLGISLMNFGRGNYDYSFNGVKSPSNLACYPGIINPRVSFGATLFEFKDFAGAFSSDLSFPSCQNLIADVALGFSYDNKIFLNTSWQFNTVEVVTNGASAIVWPSVSLSFKFAIDSSKLSKNNKDFEKSEITPSLAWQNMYNGYHVVATGVLMNFGMEDTTAPVISLWDEE